MESSTKIEVHNDNGEETSSLPEELIFDEILPRLPVKSLMRFRCVAKPWRSLIASKRLMKAHLANSIKTSLHRILFFTDDGFTHCSLSSLFNQPITDPVNLNVDFGIDSEMEFVGFSKGLVCLLIDRKRFILWNPATKKSNILPDFDSEYLKKWPITKYGLGFDELDDDFKVFGVLSVLHPYGQYIFICKVYSLRTNSWKVIEGKVVAPLNRGGKYVSGKLNWFNIRKPSIESFDLNSYVCGVVEFPNNVYDVDLMLGELGGCLSLHYLRHNTSLDVWVMKEYGVRESWYKLMTVPLNEDDLMYSIPTSVAIGQNEEILLILDESTLVVYDPKGLVFRVPLDEYAWFNDMGMYVESLASVVPDAQQQN